MGQFPVVSGRAVAKALAKLGYELDRQKGSHMILRQPSAPHRRAVVPDQKR